MAFKLSLFLAELKRRKVYRVAAVYAAVGVAISIAVPDLFGAFGFPIWAAPLVIVVIAIGFPIALVLAWAYEVRPEGPRRSYRDEIEAVPPPAASSPLVTPSPNEPAEAERKSIAVLPFVDMSPAKDQEYFCDGMAEELINALTKVEGLRVAARTSSFHFKGKSEDVRGIGTHLTVGTVLEGSVRRAGDRLRITAQLVSVEDGYHLWSESYDRELEDVFAIQDEISRAIVETLRPTLFGDAETAPEERERELVVAPTRSMEAYDYYLLGRHYWERRYERGIATALEYFEKAVETDPEYALPWCGVADSYTIFGFFEFMNSDEARHRAESAARRALELDDSLADAHASMGLYQFWLEWDWDTGAREFLKAIELNPNHAKAHVWLGLLRVMQGRFDEALEWAATAQRLEPLSRYVKTLSGAVQYLAGDRATALTLLEEVVGDDPDFVLAVWLLSWGCSHMSRHDVAVAMGERAAALSNRHGHYLGSLGMFYGRAGMLEEARRILDELRAGKESQRVSPLWLAWVHVGLGDKERALDLMAQAVAQRCGYVYDLHQDPNYDGLWHDARFRELASKVGTGVVSRAWEREGTGAVSQTETDREA